MSTTEKVKIGRVEIVNAADVVGIIIQTMIGKKMSDAENDKGDVIDLYLLGSQEDLDEIFGQYGAFVFRVTSKKVNEMMESPDFNATEITFKKDELVDDTIALIKKEIKKVAKTLKKEQKKKKKKEQMLQCINQDICFLETMVENLRYLLPETPEQDK